MRDGAIGEDEARGGILNLEEWAGTEGLWLLGPREFWDVLGSEGALDHVWHLIQGLSHGQRSLWNK